MTIHFEVVLADITTLSVDAIVNAANSTLLGGGGVDGAIHRAAGPELLAQCRHLRETSLPSGLPVGQAIATAGYKLPAKWVIHTVGPNRHIGQTDPKLLAAAFRNSLQRALECGAQSIAFPAISAGVYGWDIDEVARIAVTELQQTAQTATLNLKEPATITVYLVAFSHRADHAFRQALAQYSA
ncbi:O-acetyl-ADP-ribose deacetylase [Trueperella sp. LYQ143]|uniref:O-acetyl-ADP-ribose deacetylase n=1 Tax=unclassified Trueperella TaxID=2630174 RepID=UPI003982D9B6